MGLYPPQADGGAPLSAFLSGLVGQAVGGLTPTFSPLSVEEAAGLLQGLYESNRVQLRHGVRPVGAALLPNAHGHRQLRYIRQDAREHWRTVRDIWRHGGGDCEDLAAAVAAELTELNGVVARPVIYQVRPGLSHAVVQLGDGRILDPSRWGGMGTSA